MDFTTAAELVRGIAALSSMITSYLALRREKEKTGKFPKELKFDKEDTNQIISASHVSEKAINPKDIEILQALPKDIGHAAKDRIQKTLRRYSEAISSPLNAFDLDKETELAEFEICHTLKLIKKHNNGKLPTKQLRDLWEAFNCDKKDH
jgi:hypothetical protein